MKKLLGSLSGLALIASASCGPSSTVRDGSAGGSGGAGAVGGSGALGGTGGTGAKAGRGGGNATGSGATGGTGVGGTQTNAGRAGDVGIAGDEPGGSGGSVVVEDCVSDPTQISGSSFTVKLSGADLDNGYTTFHFADGAPGLEVVIGSEGQAYRGKVKPDGVKLVVEPGLRIRDLGGYPDWPDHNGAIIENLELCFHPPRDSSPSLDGKGTLRVIANGDDYEDEWEEAVDFVGARWDVTPPELPESKLIDPLEPDVIHVSEPLELGATVTLDADGGAPLTAVERASTVVGFRPATVLPLGFSSSVSVNGRDLAGNALDSAFVLTTKPDPGVQPLDGFESELKVVNYSYQDAELVTGDAVLEGAKSLSLPAGARALLHLKRPSTSARTILFDLRPVPWLVEIPASIVFRAAVVGGTTVVYQELPLAMHELIDDNGGGGAAGAGGAGGGQESVSVVEIEVSEPGEDILLEIETPDIELSASAVAGAIVDRLRIE